MTKRESKAKATKQAKPKARPQAEGTKPQEIDVSPEEVKAEIKVSIGKLLAKREEARKKYGSLKRTPFEAIEEKGLTDENREARIKVGSIRKDTDTADRRTFDAGSFRA